VKETEVKKHKEMEN